MRTRSFGLILVLVALDARIASRPLWAAGHLDPGFGAGGVVVTPTGGQNAETGSRAVAVGATGKIVALASGNAGKTVVARYTAAGALDPTFGAGGMVTLSLPNPFWGIGVAVRGGKVVVGGSAEFSPTAQVALVRLDGSGALDPTFGTGGVVLTPVAAASGSAGAWRVAIAADGSVTAAGTYLEPSSIWRAFVARYDANGVLDAGYGTGGLAIVPLAETVNLGDLAVYGDGSALVVGGVGPQPPPQTSLLPYLHSYVARFDATGTPDASFGTGGVVSDAIDGYFEGVALQGDGAIVTGGPVAPPGGSLQALFARFLPGGSPDPTFGTSGVTRVEFPDQSLGYVHRVLLQSDGRIVGVGSQIKYFWRPALVRLDENGLLDPSFGLGGVSFSPFFGSADPTPGESNFVYDAALAPNGDIVASSGMYGFTSPPAVRLHEFLGHGLPCLDPAGMVAPKLVMAGFGLPSSRTSISFKGKADPPGYLPINDGASTTFGIRVTDATGATVFEEVVPAINEGGMWTYSGRKSSYASSDPTSAVRRVKLLAQKAGDVSFDVPVQVKGKAARFGVAMPVLPLNVTVLLNRSAGVCARTAFVEGSCVASATRVRCR
jgi:uncharacterized delta-60 repeat protein